MVINCMKPDYLKAGDRVALISPSYFSPMENVEKTAEVMRDLLMGITASMWSPDGLQS